MLFFSFVLRSLSLSLRFSRTVFVHAKHITLYLVDEEMLINREEEKKNNGKMEDSSAIVFWCMFTYVSHRVYTGQPMKCPFHYLFTFRLFFHFIQHEKVHSCTYFPPRCIQSFVWVYAFISRTKVIRFRNKMFCAEFGECNRAKFHWLFLQGENLLNQQNMFIYPRCIQIRSLSHTHIHTHSNGQQCDESSNIVYLWYCFSFVVTFVCLSFTHITNGPCVCVRTVVRALIWFYFSFALFFITNPCLLI